MLKLAGRTVGALGTIIGVVSVVVAISNLPIWLSAVLWFSLALSVITIAADIGNYVKNRPHRFKPNSEAIAEYMLNWLKSGGLAAVFSRNFNWVTPGSDVERILLQKAKRGELILFVSEEKDLTVQLREEGAAVYIYPKGYAPHSRFTIIDYKKNGSRIAIGAFEDGKHTIREYPLGPSPTSLAGVVTDLLYLAEASIKRK